jgi:hypothetical protein
MFIAAIVVGYFLTDCSKSGIYPVSFVIGDGLFFVMYFLLNTLNEDMEEHWDKNLDEKQANAK